MLTTLKINIDYKDDPAGKVIGTQKVVIPNAIIPIYIPRLMTKIKKSSTKNITIEEIPNASWIFKNASECKPKTKTRLECRNYLEGTLKDPEPTYLKDNDLITCYLHNNSPHRIRFSLK